MFSKFLELTGLTLISVAIAYWARWEAGVLFAGISLILLGSITDDEAVGLTFRRYFELFTFVWRRQLAAERGEDAPTRSAYVGLVRCTCGGDPDCPLCDGMGWVPDPRFQVNRKSPHPSIRVDPEAQMRAERLARARAERAKLGDRTPALTRHGPSDNNLERLD